MSDEDAAKADSLGRIEALLQQGVGTPWRDRAGSGEAINQVIARLQALAADDLEAKLRIAGLTTGPHVAEGEDGTLSQSCRTCMYFAVHRRWCELPELQLPVRAQWSCRLWRI